MEDQPVFTPMRASLNRPQLLMGGDRELVLLSGLLGGIDGCQRYVVSVLLNCRGQFYGDCCGVGQDGQRRPVDAKGLCAAFVLQGFLSR